LVLFSELLLKIPDGLKAYKESTKAYLEQHKLVRQANAHLAKLDETTSKVTGSSKKYTKKP
jgi:hypothetical protein